MISAFGIDHGDAVSKGGRLPRGPGGKRLTRAQRATGGRGKAGPTRPQQVKEGLNRVGEADVSIKGVGRAAGSGFNGVGGFMRRHPGLTGTAFVGGGGAGGAYYLANRQPKKKQT